jgi:hypothetical protein
MDAKMVVCQCPQVAGLFQTPISFPAVKQGDSLGIKTSKSTYMDERDVRKPLAGSFYKEFWNWRAETMPPKLRI